MIVAQCIIDLAKRLLATRGLEAIKSSDLAEERRYCAELEQRLNDTWSIDPENLLEAAETCIAKGQPLAAMAILHAILNATPDHELALMLYGKASWSAHRIRDAFPFFERGHAVNPRLGIFLAPEFYSLKEKAAGKGLPSVMLITQPKSGSIYIRGLFEEGLGLPWCYISPPGLFDGIFIPSWLVRLQGGGSVCQGHPDPSREFLLALAKAGIHNVVVHVRDPRQSYISTVHHWLEDRSNPFLSGQLNDHTDFATIFNKNFAKEISGYAGWAKGWLDLEHNDAGIRILYTQYETMVDNKRKFVDDILSHYGIDTGLFNYEVIKEKLQVGEKHFRKGLKSEWRDIFTEEQKEQALDLIPPELLQRFGWPVA